MNYTDEEIDMFLAGCTETAKDPQKVITKDQDLCLRSLRIGDSQKRYVVESSVLLQEEC